VEEEFWEWIAAEDKRLAVVEAQPADVMPLVQIVLSSSVEPADWQTLVKDIRTVNKYSTKLPTNTAFVLEGELVEKEADRSEATKRTEFQFRAVFEADQFWIADDSQSVSGADRLLMSQSAICAKLVRNDSGSFEGRVRPGWARNLTRQQASKLFASYLGELDPAQLPPFREEPRVEGTCHINQLLRPNKGRITRGWHLGFTWRQANADHEISYQVVLDSGPRWWITRIVDEIPGQWGGETDAEYGHIGDAFMPVTLHSRCTHEQGEESTSWRVRPMSESERQELKQRVELAVRSGSRNPYQGLRYILLVIVIACPLFGIILPGTTRSCKAGRSSLKQ
jgi:hypothetical protein